MEFKSSGRITTPTPGEVGVGEITALSDHRNLNGYPVFGSDSPSAAIPDGEFGDRMGSDGPTKRRGPDGVS